MTGPRLIAAPAERSPLDRLEDALIDILSVAHVLRALADGDDLSEALRYLSAQLQEHREAAIAALDDLTKARAPVMNELR